MAKTFISYKRIDEPFIHLLDQALREHGHDTWVDLTGIPPTAVFMEEIRAAIERADAVIFILSPESITSEVCGQEVEYAVLHNKRLIPLVRREVDRHRVPDALAERNWIFCREKDDFAAALATLLAAIEADLEWVSTHSRLTVRAVEWDKQKRDPSYLLRGVDLMAGESALVRAGETTQPQPTKLQQDYVLASRRNAIKRQRLLLRSVTAGLAVALGLAAYAFWESSVANFERGEAEQAGAFERGERKLADSARSRAEAATKQVERRLRETTGFLLAARSVEGTDYAPQRRLLLAYEAVQATRRAKEPVVPEAEQALRKWLAYFSGRSLRGHIGPVYKVLVSSRSFAATSGSDGTVRIWELSAADPLVPRAVVHTGPNGYGAAIGFSPDGWLVVGQADGTITLWDPTATDRATPARVLQGHRGGVSALEFAPGDRLVSAGGDGNVRVWDSWRNEQEIKCTALPGHYADFPVHLAVDQEGHLVTLDGARAVRVWDLNRLEPSSPLVLEKGDGAKVLNIGDAFLRLGPGGHLLVAGDNDGPRVWNLRADKPLDTVRRLRGHSGLVTAAAYWLDGRLVTGGYNGDVRVWSNNDDDPSVGSTALSLQSGYLLTDITILGDGRLVTVGDNSLVRVWDIRKLRPGQKNLEPDRTLTGHDGVIRSLARTPGRRFVTAGDDGTVRLWDLEEFHRSDLYDTVVYEKTWMTHMPQAAYGGRYATLDKSGLVRVWDGNILVASAPLTSMQFPAGANRLRLSAEGRIAIASEVGKVSWWDLSAQNPQEAVRSFIAENGWLGFIEFLANDRIVTQAQDRIKIWELTTPGPRYTEVELPKATFPLWLAPDGRLFLSGTSPASLFTLDLTVAEPARTLVKLAGPGDAGHPLITSDGFLATLGSGGSLSLWKVKPADAGIARVFSPPRRLTAERVGRLPEPFPIDLLSTPNGRLIAVMAMTARAGRGIELWIWNPKDPDPSLTAYSLRERDISGGSIIPTTNERLAACNSDGVVFLWDLTAADPPRSRVRLGEGLPLGRGGVLQALSDDRIAVQGQDKLVHVFSTNLNHLMASAERIVGRDFTREEWTQYFPGQEYRTTLDQPSILSEQRGPEPHHNTP